MRVCAEINDLVFDTYSQNKLRLIKSKLKTARLLSGMIIGGVFADIFAKNGTIAASYKISQTDWVTFARALKASEHIARHQIDLIASEAYFYYSGANHDEKLRLFWMGIYYGC